MAGVKHAKTLDAIATVPRHAFMDAGLHPQAYEDSALPIGHQQTISKPSVVARMIELLHKSKQPLNKVLEIGTGCGYQAAVLSLLANEVYSIERIRPLHDLARDNLRPFRIKNLRLIWVIEQWLGFFILPLIVKAQKRPRLEPCADSGGSSPAQLRAIAALWHCAPPGQPNGRQSPADLKAHLECPNPPRRG